MALQPTVTSQGIKYIKVNKQDFNGLNLNVPLSQLDALRIRYSNGTIGQYNLLGEPSEYPDYYLLRVSPNSSFTSSADNTILNYLALASKGFSSIPTSFSKIDGFTVSSNPGGYFNGTTGEYTVPNLTNIPIQITGSFQVEETGGTTADVELELVSSGQGILDSDSVSLTAFSVDTLLVNYKGTFTEDEIIYFNWRRQGSADNTGISSVTFTQSIAANTPSENLIIFEPYNTTNFYNSDYNAIINNSEVNRLSSDYQLVDYATNQLTPVNFTQLIQGIGTRASVQDSNYTSYQYSGIRYWGSKNTTDNFNSPLTSQSLVVQNYQNDDIGATTLGYASVNLFDVGLLEYNWGGGTYPEIQGAGALSLNQMLLVGGNKDAVGIYNAQQLGFLTASAIEFPIGATPTFFQYTTNVSTITGTKVAAYGFSTPQIANYFIPANYISSSAFDGVSLDFTNATDVFSEVTTNNSGYYITSSQFIQAQDIVSEVSSSLAQGDKWFISIYRFMNSPIDEIYNPYIETSATYPNPQATNLGSLGVYEITSTTTSPAYNLVTNLTNSGISISVGNSIFGALIWKAVKGEYMILSGNTLSGLGKGTLLGSVPSPVIETNLVYITQEYGINPRNS
jgi:hypothetical protein